MNQSVVRNVIYGLLILGSITAVILVASFIWTLLPLIILAVVAWVGWVVWQKAARDLSLDMGMGGDRPARAPVAVPAPTPGAK